MRFSVAFISILIFAFAAFAAPSASILFPAYGQTVAPPVSLTFSYDADGTGPAYVMCTAYLDGYPEMHAVRVQSKGTTVAAYPPVPGENNIHVICTGDNSFSLEFDHQFNITNVSKVFPVVTAISPPKGYVVSDASAPVDFTFKYDKGTGDVDIASCILMFYNDSTYAHLMATFSDSADVASGVEATVSALVPYGSTSWEIECYDPTQQSDTMPVISDYMELSVKMPGKVYLESPEPGGDITANGYPESTFIYSYASIGGPKYTNCSLFIDGSIYDYSRNIAGETSYLVKASIGNLSMGTHTWSVSCGPNSDIGASSTFVIPPNWLDQWSVKIDEPVAGQVFQTPGNVKFTYNKGVIGPDAVWCALFSGDTQLTNQTGATSGQQSSIPLDKTYGPMDIKVTCTYAGFSVSSPDISFIANATFTDPTVTVISPLPGYSATSNTPTTFVVAYYPGDSQGTVPTASCAIVFYNAGAKLSSSSAVNIDGYAQGSISVQAPLGASSYDAECADPQGKSSKFPIKSDMRSITVSVSTGVSPPVAVLETSGSGGGRGTGSGGGAVSPRPSATTVTGTTSPPLAASPNASANGANTNETLAPSLPKAVLTVQSDGFTNETVTLLLKTEDGKPLAGVDIYARVPNSSLSIKLTTDAQGKALFAPPVEGDYTFRAAGYQLEGNPAISIAQNPNIEAKPKSTGVDWSQMGNLLLLLAAVILVLVIFYSGYKIVAGKPGQPEEPGTEGPSEPPASF